mmetsp:Transcript_23018/g.38090  ORF Transcript_23018/g.38090 Transcript_23018/m.38090 type:complete len:83 (-) Transcript_23018:93-341(-)
MGCCASQQAADEPTPMSGSSVVGSVGGSTVSRDEQRERAAAAAEARAKAAQTRGQQGPVSKMKPSVDRDANTRGGPEPLVWD